jgi:hypothetical protein
MAASDRVGRAVSNAFVRDFAVSAAGDFTFFGLRSIAERETGLVRCLSGQERWLSIAFRDALPKQNQLSHSGQFCADASDIIAGSMVNPIVVNNRSLVIGALNRSRENLGLLPKMGTAPFGGSRQDEPCGRSRILIL